MSKNKTKQKQKQKNKKNKTKKKQQKKKNSCMDLTDPNFAFWEKFWLSFARIIKNQPFF